MAKLKVKVGIGILLLIVIGIFYASSYSLPVYTYESTDRGLAISEIPWKGKTLEQVEKEFENYKANSSDSTLELRRTFQRDWSSPNLWYENITSRRWQYEYMAPSKL